MAMLNKQMVKFVFGHEMGMHQPIPSHDLVFASNIGHVKAGPCSARPAGEVTPVISTFLRVMVCLKNGAGHFSHT